MGTIEVNHIPHHKCEHWICGGNECGSCLAWWNRWLAKQEQKIFGTAEYWKQKYIDQLSKTTHEIHR
jgi:hypothetical protein